MEKEFKEYLIRIELQDSTIGRYVDAIKFLSKQYGVDIYKITNLQEYRNHKNVIFGIEEFKIKNKSVNNCYTATMNHYEEFLMQKPYYDRLKNGEEIEPDKHDGSYELVRETVKQYNMMLQENIENIQKIGYQDADLIYSMTLGNWCRSIDKKKEAIDKSNLDDIKKNYLKGLLSQIVEKAKNGEYFNENAKNNAGEVQIGMFGTGLGSFSKFKDNDENYKRLITICTNVNNMQDERQIFNYLKNELDNPMKGIQSGVISTILHCLKPNVFPIFNNKQNEGSELYKILGIQLHEEGEAQNYIENAKKIKKFRDNNFSWKNYRVMDLIHLNEEQNDLNNIYAFVGAYVDGIDKTDEFIAKGIWENYKTENIEDVKSIEVGTPIAIKSSCTTKNLPYISKEGEYTSLLTIKAIGKVTKNYNDGKTLDVEWTKFEEPKLWYKYAGKYGLWNTIAKINYQEASEEYKNLIDFTFFDKKQNFDLILKKSKEGLGGNGTKEPNDFVGENIIYYGVPGCGKSSLVQQEVEEPGKYKNGYRILFHPEYTYSDFIGQLLPKREADGKVTYEFEPGPFSEILKQALNNLDENYYLVIEELNRGNAPAIFGDIFQLLDRLNENKGEYVEGDSRFPIKNNQILDYINKDITTEKLERLYIPHNLSIFATMNTNDQNVFTLDTAFKRRWHFKRITNKFDNQHKYKDKEIGKTKIEWQTFVEKINEQICDVPDLGINNEDKQIGKYFLSEKEIESDDMFAEKLLPYLWEDVLKFNKYEIFNKDYKTLEQLIDGYKMNGMKIFNFNFSSEEVKDESKLEN